MKHTIQMLAGCVLPLLLLFILPLLGISGGASLLIAVVALFIGHMWMMSGHGGHGGQRGGCGMAGERHRHNGDSSHETDATRRLEGADHEYHQH